MKKFKIGAIVVCVVTALAGITWSVRHLFSDECEPCSDDDGDCNCSK